MMAKTLRVPNLPKCADRSFASAMLDGVGHAFGTVLVYGILVVAAFFAIRKQAKKAKDGNVDGEAGSMTDVLRNVVQLRSSGGASVALNAPAT
jgi:hypothetical protein